MNETLNNFNIEPSALDSIEEVGELLKKDNYLNHIFDIFQKQSTEIIQEIKEEFSKKNATRVRILAHKLKGSAQSMGLKNLTLVCSEIELLVLDKKPVSPMNIDLLERVYKESGIILEEEIGLRNKKN